MHVFVTGATGFIGTELVKELIAARQHVRGLTELRAQPLTIYHNGKRLLCPAEPR
jgi:nucleoside-diphosphate-sugar epimerase